VLVTPSTAFLAILAILALLGSVAALAFSLLAVQGAREARGISLPSAELHAAMTKLGTEQHALREEWRSTLGSLDAAMEAIEERTGTLDRKRRRAQASVDRLADAEQKPNGEQAEGDLMARAYRSARASGLPV
jgi:hypothetical protein